MSSLLPGDLWLRAASAARRMAGARIDAAAPALAGHHVAALAADGIDLAQLDALKIALRLAGAKVSVIAARRGRLRARDGRRSVAAQPMLRTHPPAFFDALYVPGGKHSVDSLCDDDEVLRFVREAYRQGMPIAASGDGVLVLRMAGIHVPDDAARAAAWGLIIAGARQRALAELGRRFVAAIAQGRHWPRAAPGALPA